MCLRKRCEWRGITVRIEEIKNPDDARISGCDIFMIGGGSDREQAIANCFKQALLLFYIKIYNKFSYLKIITM
ncbi:hypothetical protein NDK43_32605 [Neobacillus pocheonensis]|uniref:Uncharacterized protein n=1 Tax=Neobacillus pocheonensis TaxID=363869 RepID=A0ABT0WIL7_9BACI|nr:hypothetical protein [Neobacillus pocheonensis]